MSTHIIDGEFQSDKYPTTPRGKVPLSVKDPAAQDLLWQYAQRRRAVDAEFSDDLETALRTAGYVPSPGAVDKERVRSAVYAAVADRFEGFGPASVASHAHAIADRAAEQLAGVATVGPLPALKEWTAEAYEDGECEGSQYIEGWNDAIDAVSVGRCQAPAPDDRAKAPPPTPVAVGVLKLGELEAARAAMTPASGYKAEAGWNNAGMPLADFAIPGHNEGATVEMLAGDAFGIVALVNAADVLIELAKAARALGEADIEYLLGQEGAESRRRGYKAAYNEALAKVTL